MKELIKDSLDRVCSKRALKIRVLSGVGTYDIKHYVVRGTGIKMVRVM